MDVAVLGPLTVNGRSTGLAPRDRVVLEALATRPREVLTSAQIADALWPDTPPVTWSKVVQGSVVRLRKLLGPDAIETVDHGAEDVGVARMALQVDDPGSGLSLGGVPVGQRVGGVGGDEPVRPAAATVGVRAILGGWHELGCR